jgi:hypothetical protein
MTTTVKVACNGDFVAMVVVDGAEAVNVGPGSNVEKSFSYPHDGEPHTYEVTERAATKAEIEAAKTKK